MNEIWKNTLMKFSLFNRKETKKNCIKLKLTFSKVFLIFLKYNLNRMIENLELINILQRRQDDVLLRKFLINVEKRLQIKEFV
jgi:hypothetical protein